jgi:hypothetical protein
MDSQDVLDSESTRSHRARFAPLVDWKMLSTALTAVGVVVALLTDVDLMLFGIGDQVVLQWHLVRWAIACACIVAAVPITHGLAGKYAHQR